MDDATATQFAHLHRELAEVRLLVNKVLVELAGSREKSLDAVKLAAALAMARPVAVKRPAAVTERESGLLASCFRAMPAAVADRGAVFNTAEMLARLKASAPEQARALSQKLGGQRKNASRRLGWLLARACGKEIGGHVLARAGSDRSGALWVLKPAENSQTRSEP